MIMFHFHLFVAIKIALIGSSSLTSTQSNNNEDHLQLHFTVGSSILNAGKLDMVKCWKLLEPPLGFLSQLVNSVVAVVSNFTWLSIGVLETRKRIALVPQASNRNDGKR